MNSRTKRTPPRWRSDWPSALFLLAVVTNTTLIALSATPWLVVPLTLLQALLLTGCQEAKHLCAHGTFVGSRDLNDAIGIACAALVGQNFFAFRYFHLAHHPVPCTEADPEGPLYARSWRTRWIWLLAPAEVPWVAWHLTRTGWSMVPRAKHARRNAALVWLAIFVTLIALGTRHVPHAIAFAYLIPLALSAWFDFLLTQAEHYGTAIAPASCRRAQGAIANDIALPFGLGWLLLHRPLHRAHHCEPALRWFDVPRRMKTDATAYPIGYIAFARRWLTNGPRLWLTERGSLANVDVRIRSRSRSRSRDMMPISDARPRRGKPLFWNGTLVHSRSFDALSLILPAGEAFLIDTLETWRTRCAMPIDTALDSEVQRFVREERTHRQAHVRYNDVLITGLPEARAVAERANRVTAELDKLSLQMKIALAAAFEHLTAVLSEEIGSHGILLADGESHAAKLWRWHAREELGHRDVAIDVATRAGLSRGTLRLALLLATAYLLSDLMRYTFALCLCDIRSGSITRRAAAVDAARFSLRSLPSLVRMARGWARYLAAPLHQSR